MRLPTWYPASVRLLLTSTLFTALAACGPVAGDGQSPDPPLTPEERSGIALLFADVGGELSESARAEVYRTLGVSVSAEGGSLVDGVCGQPAGHAVRLEDLDGDGDDEVIVDWGNTCTSGMAGTTVSLFIADAQGRYHHNLGFPGVIAEVLEERTDGYADLLVGGPGFCHAVWGWNGTEYAYVRDFEETPGACGEVGL